MIAVSHVTCRYGAKVAVDDVSFSIASKEVVGFLGPNGAGKTSTIKVITGFRAPHAGTVVVDGIDVVAAPQRAQERLGYLPETAPLYGDMRVIEFLRYRAAIKGVAAGRRTRLVDAAVEQCGIGDVRNRLIGQLSKGYRQRVGLAEALVADPSVVVLDEPTVGLDPAQVREVRALVRSLGKERTVLLSTHILSEVEAVCSRVLVLHQGKLVGEGKTEELRRAAAGARVYVEARDPKDALVAALERRGLSVHQAAREGAVVRLSVAGTADGDLRELVFATAVEAGSTLRELRTEQSSLEDVFLALVQGDGAPSAAPDAAANEGPDSGDRGREKAQEGGS